MTAFSRIRLAGLLLAFAVLWPAAPSLAVPARQGQPEGCTVEGTKTASPARIRLGETVQIKLTLTPKCPPATFRAADIVLVIDRSLSMNEDNKIMAARTAAKSFVGAVDLSIHQIGLAVFSGTASLEQGLTQNKTLLNSAIDKFSLGSGTNLSAGIDTAKGMLDSQGRPGVLSVIIVMTDGEPNLPSGSTVDPYDAATRSANDAKIAGMEIYTIALGLDNPAAEDLLRKVASSPSNYFSSPTGAQLDTIYKQVAQIVGDYSVRDLTLDDDLTVDVVLEPSTPNPGAASVTGRRVTWKTGLVPGAGVEWTYVVKPQRIGTYPTNEKAIATYDDLSGVRKEFEFPKPIITVLDPQDLQPCNTPNPWIVAVSSFPDTVGVATTSVGQGCNNRFDSGDWAIGTQFALPQLEYLLTDESGTKVLFRGKAVLGPGRVDQRLQMRACIPPPYKLKLLTPAQDLNGYKSCPNSPTERILRARDFHGFKYREERFGFIRQNTPYP